MLLQKTVYSDQIAQRGTYRRPKMLDLFTEFEKMEENVVEVTNWEGEYANAHSLTNGINNAAKHFRLTQYKAFECKGHVFIRKVYKQEEATND